MRVCLLLWLILSVVSAKSQDLYFPPILGDEWETVSPAELGWCEEGLDELYSFLASSNTKAFIVLKDGRIAIEQYFDSFTQDSVWYWASAGKSLTATLVGIAAQQGHLNLDDPTNQHLGEGWTNCTTEAENDITIWHQLTMTSGLDDREDSFCTTPECLNCIAEPESRWAYHNGPYTLLGSVLEAATGQSLNIWFNQQVRNKTGITGLYVPLGYNRIFLSKPRSMARFGLMSLNKGNWGNTPVLGDDDYWEAMISPSQTLNPAYGYLWWLNGQSSYRLPVLQASFSGSLTPQAPADMVSAIGKNGQIINIVPSQNLVLIRMGNAPDNSLVPTTFVDDIWEYFNEVNCSVVDTDEYTEQSQLKVFPNPTHEQCTISWPGELFTYRLYQQGQSVRQGSGIDHSTVDITGLPSGLYTLRIRSHTKGVQLRRILVQ